MEILDKMYDLKFVRINSLTKDSIFIGKYLDNTVIIAIKTVSFTDTDVIKKIIGSKNNTKIFDNDRFRKYMCNLENDYEVTILYPVLNEDITKYIPVTKKIVFETPEIYMKQIYPKAISQDLLWIHNIFEGKAEREDMLYNDDDFVLLPDMKWVKRNVNSDTSYDNMYCLAIVKNGNLKSIRDLRQEHIPLLKSIYENGTNAIKELYGINKDQIRVYFHYRPTFWHLHIHFNLISNIEEGTTIDYSHRLQTVITNLELKSNYYEEATLEVIELIME